MRYKYKDKEYLFLYIIQMKNKETRQWYDAAVYVSADQKKLYGRELNEFYERFVKI